MADILTDLQEFIANRATEGRDSIQRSDDAAANADSVLGAAGHGFTKGVTQTFNPFIPVDDLIQGRGNTTDKAITAASLLPVGRFLKPVRKATKGAKAVKTLKGKTKKIKPKVKQTINITPKTQKALPNAKPKIETTKPKFPKAEKTDLSKKPATTGKPKSGRLKKVAKAVAPTLAAGGVAAALVPGAVKGVLGQNTTAITKQAERATALEGQVAALTQQLQEMMANSGAGAGAPTGQPEVSNLEKLLAHAGTSDQARNDMIAQLMQRKPESGSRVGNFLGDMAAGFGGRDVGARISGREAARDTMSPQHLAVLQQLLQEKSANNLNVPQLAALDTNLTRDPLQNAGITAGTELKQAQAKALEGIDFNNPANREWLKTVKPL